MATMRHWKQKWDFEADLVFLKRLTLRCCGVDTVERGDPVTQAMKDHFGKHRLLIWWRGGFLEIDEFPKEKPSHVHLGGGYYDVTYPDGKVERIRGKANLPV